MHFSAAPKGLRAGSPKQSLTHRNAKSVGLIHLCCRDRGFGKYLILGYIRRHLITKLRLKLGSLLKPMSDLPYLRAYPQSLRQQVSELLNSGKLGEVLARRYSESRHHIQTDKSLYEYTLEIKRQFLRSSEPLSKVVFDPKLHIIHNALGTHSQVSRVQGGKLKSKNEIRICSQLKQLPLPLLRMLVVHELAHLKEKEHNKAFYQLCQYMEPHYHQLELDLRLFLTWQEQRG